MTDPVQLLIDAGAIPSSPFDPSSRYHGLPLALSPGRPDAPVASGLAYVTRRFMPARSSIAIAAEHLVRASERPDTLAALHHGCRSMGASQHFTPGFIEREDLGRSV